MKSILIALIIILFFGCVAEGQTFSCGSGDTEWSAGLTWTDGIEPGDASVCPNGYTCHYVDCDAVSDGTGTYASPYWGFETVLGYLNAGDFYEGVVKRTNDSKQIVYVKGTCDYGTSVESSTGPFKQIRVWRSTGSASDPVIVKSYPGIAQAIFDGEGTGHRAIEFKNTAGAVAGGGFLIENFRITDYIYDGISVQDSFEYIDIHSVTVDNIDGDGDGTYGPIMIYQRDTDSKQTALIRNCYLHTNDLDATGGLSNRGTIRHHGVYNAHADSTFTVQNTIVEDGAYCFQDKHFGGNVLIKESICSNAIGMAYIRADSIEFDRVIWDSINVDDPTGDGSSGFFLSKENIEAGYDVSVNIHNCTIYDLTSKLFTADPVDDDIAVTFEDNIIDDSAYTGRPIYLAPNSGDSLVLLDQNFGGNIYNISSSTQSGFAWYKNTGYSFSGFNTLFSDTTSTVADPGLVDPSNGDFDSSLTIGACVLSAEPEPTASTGRKVISEALNPLSPSRGLGM